jgi:Protein of unknown function (DUF3047)
VSAKILPLLLVALLAPAAFGEGPLLKPFAVASAAPPSPWHVAGLPNQKKPYTKFSLVDLDGHRALRVEAAESYGNLVHPVAPDAPASRLAWQWRIDEAVEAADLREKQGDDTALKVCVFFDMPLEQVPFVERQLLKVARAQSNELLPSATVCYVWDSRLAPGTAIDNAFTRRMRYIVLQGPAAPLRRWASERRDVAADFTRLFGNESATVPPVIGVAIGADTDNTHSHSVGYVADIVLEP